MARPKQVLKWTGRIFTGLVVIVAVAAATVLLVIPQVTGGAALTVLSGSMTPTYPVGSVVMVEPVDPEDVRVDDVITFATATSLTTHRVLDVVVDEMGTPSFITKGDANRGPDTEPVTADALRGRVAFHVPLIGKVRDVLSSPLGLLLIAIFAGLSAAWDRLTAASRRGGLPAWLRPRRREGSSAPTVTQHPHAPPGRARAHEPPLDTHDHDTDVPEIALPTVQLGLSSTDQIEHQFLLARLAVRPSVRREVLEVLELVRGQVVAIGPRHMVVSVSGTHDYLDGVEQLLRPCGIVESQRTQPVRVGGDPCTETAVVDRSEAAPTAESLSLLQLGTRPTVMSMPPHPVNGWHKERVGS